MIDGNSCIFSTTFSIGGGAGPSSATVATSNANCGIANGSSTVTGVTGGATPYTYSFDGGAFTTTTNTVNLAAGSHSVIVKDAGGCTLNVPYTVNSNGAPTSTITASANVTCFGLSNGSFTVSGSGGSGGSFTYTLTSPLAINGTGYFTGLPAGTYNVIIKDGAGCPTTNSVTLTEPPLLTLSATSLPAKCFGTATGTINLTGGGGTPTYSYNLNGGANQSSPTYTSAGSGTYMMGIIDGHGCTATQSVQVTQPPALGITVSSQNANCTASNGVASATVTGGTPLYTYTWTSTGGASDVSTPLPGGTYTITATDLNGCVISSPVTIGITPGGSAAITASTNITCNGFNNGSMTAAMTTAVSFPTYIWNTVPTQTTATATNLAPGSYTCEITDFYGCKAYASGTITQPPVLGAIMNSNNVKCFGTATGTVSAAGTGGTSGYTYLWPALSSTLSTVNDVAVGAGFYNCTITDANGCSITQSISITQPSPVSLTSTVTAANCNGSNGSATVTAMGGTPAYTYTWSTVPVSTSSVVTNQFAGTYNIIVQDANGCIENLAATIPNIAGPTATITAKTDVNCFGGNNGSATISASGGVTPYTIQWSHGANTPTATNLTANLYTVSVTDQAGCVASASVNITEPTALTVSITPTNPKCAGASNGSGLAAAFGGVGGYTYAWSGSAGGNATTSPIPAGPYSLIVTDGNGCTVTSTMTLTDPPLMLAGITSTNVSCFNACNGVAVATTTNAVGVVSYYWTGGTNPIPTQTAAGLCVGNYTVLATDQNSCTANAVVSITQPTQVTANITSSGSVTCNGGNNGFAVVAPGGGTPSYSFTWTGPLGIAGNGTNANNLTAGVYTVTVSDQNTCTATANVTILEPAPLVTVPTFTNPKCFGSTDGVGNIAYSGGAGGTTFQWLPNLQSGTPVNNLASGAQTVIVTNNGSCVSSITFTLTDPPVLTAVTTGTSSNCGQSNGKTCATVGGGVGPYDYLWSNGPITLCNPNVPAAAYGFTVTDSHGCMAYGNQPISDIAGPSVQVLSTSSVTCYNGNNGAATTTVTGGVTPYTIGWSAPSTATTQNVNNFTSSPSPYAITVTDAAGCVGTNTLLIVQPTQLVSAIGSQTNVSCATYTDGAASMLVNGGTSPYTYTWTPSAQNTPVLVGVPAGTYTCNVTDNNGCGTFQQVTIQQPLPLAMTGSLVTNITCNGYNNGQITTNVSGGWSSMYTYSWTPTQPNLNTITNLAPGTYNLDVRDNNGCFLNTNFTVLEPSAITSGFTSTPAKCELFNGVATVTVTGGTPNVVTPPGYIMNWNTSPPQQGPTATGLAPGANWQCVITDLNGCTTTQTVYVANAPSPTLPTFTVTRPTCPGGFDGSIVIGYTSGTPNYEVSWTAPISVVQTSSATTQMVTSVGAGSYTATVKDFYGCSRTAAVTVTQPTVIIVNPTPTQTICFGQSAQISAPAGGGTPPYVYSWTPAGLSGAGPHNVNPTVNTSYIVSVTDNNGCSVPPKTINVVVTPSLSIITNPIVACDSDIVTLNPLMTSGGNGGPYNFTWSNGTVNSNVITSSIDIVATYPNTPNHYTVTVDDGGCTSPNATAVFTVDVNPRPSVIFMVDQRKGCAPLPVTFTELSNVSGNTYEWSADKNIIGNGPVLTHIFNDSDTLSIGLTVTTPQGCTRKLVKNDWVIIYPKPIASFFATPPVASILEPTIYFTNTSQGAVTYSWDFGDPSVGTVMNTSSAVNPTHFYDHTGTYNVHLFATSVHTCIAEALIQVEITPDFALYIPNAFTPDGNNTNEFFQPAGIGINEDNYRMDIFDRWGELIFTSNNFRKGWDGSVKGGKSAPQGVYIYRLMVYDMEGNKHPFTGHVTVIRKDN